MASSSGGNYYAPLDTTYPPSKRKKDNNRINLDNTNEFPIMIDNKSNSNYNKTNNQNI